VFSFPRGLKAERCRPMPSYARLLILRESKKHAAFSPAASACPAVPVQVVKT